MVENMLNLVSKIFNINLCNHWSIIPAVAIRYTAQFITILTRPVEIKWKWKKK